MDVSDDEVISDNNLELDLNEGEEPVIGKDEFSKLQNLSPEDFKVALNYSINHAAEAGYAAAIGSDSILKESEPSSSNLLPSIVMLPFQGCG